MEGENRTCLTQAHRASTLRSGCLAQVGTAICVHAAIRNLWKTAKVLTSLPRLWLYWELEQLSQEKREADSRHSQALGRIIHSVSLECFVFGKDLKEAALTRETLLFSSRLLKGGFMASFVGVGQSQLFPKSARRHQDLF